MNFTNILFALLTVSSVCEKHKNFEEVYTGNKIKCSKNVKHCPKSIVVKAKDVMKSYNICKNMIHCIRGACMYVIVVSEEVS